MSHPAPGPPATGMEIIRAMHTPWKPSVTVAAVIEKDGRFLLVEEETNGGLKLNNPAGHLDPGETPAQGCAREVMEESAYIFRPTALLGVYLARSLKKSTGEDQTYLRMAFCGELGAHDPSLPLDDGIVRTLVDDDRRSPSQRGPASQPAGAQVHRGLHGRRPASAVGHLQRPEHPGAAGLNP